MTTLAYKRISVPQMERDFAAAFKPHTDRISGLLLNAASVDETITLKGPHLDALLDQAGDIAQQMYTGPEMTPASVFGADGVSARSPFARVLNEWYVQMVYRAVKVQHDWLRRRVPDDVYRWLQTVGRPVPLAEGQIPAIQYLMREQENPFLRRDNESVDAYRERLRDLRIFEPNPIAEYEAMHTWVDPGGYTLSRRIWRAGVNTRLKLDAMLRDAIAEGRSAREIARMAEQFLLPGRALLRTNKPYGTNAAFDAMRLARTEIASAANRAAEIAAYMNPWVDRADIARSPNGDLSCPVCPKFATIGVDGQRGGQGAHNSEPYRLDSVPTPVYHPHCVTPGQIVQTMRGNIPIEHVVPGDYVLTHTGNYKRVRDAWSRPFGGMVYKTTMSDGSQFELTFNHPVLTLDGWFDAQFLEPGQQIRYAIVGTGLNLDFGVSDGGPSKSTQFGVSNGVSFGSMPEGAVTFDGNLAVNQGEVNPVTPNGILGDILNGSTVKGGSHRTFERASATTFSDLAQFGMGSTKTGVSMLFGDGNFAADFGVFRYVVVAGHIFSSVDFFEHLARSCRAGAIVPFPLKFDGITTGSQFQSAYSHDVSETAVLQSELRSDFWISQTFNSVKANQQITDRFTELSFNSEDMPLGTGQTMRLGMLSRIAKSPAANGAGEEGIVHDNLLSLSPDVGWGTDSGKPVVRRVANPPQALLYYNTVEQVEGRWYEGLVYNMSVDDDNSYTVNGAAVHNCMCRMQPVVSATPAEVTERLRAVMQDARRDLLEPYLTPVQIDTFTRGLLGDVLYRLLPVLVG